MPVLNPYVLLVIVAALAGSHWYVYAKGVEDARNEAAATELLIERAGEAAARTAAQAIASIEVRNVTIRQRVEREIHEKTVYRECRHTPDGLRAVNAALAGSEPAGDRQLPGARTDGG